MRETGVPSKEDKRLENWQYLLKLLKYLKINRIPISLIDSDLEWMAVCALCIFVFFRRAPVVTKKGMETLERCILYKHAPTRLITHSRVILIPK